METLFGVVVCTQSDLTPIPLTIMLAVESVLTIKFSKFVIVVYLSSVVVMLPIIIYIDTFVNSL